MLNIKIKVTKNKITFSYKIKELASSNKREKVISRPGEKILKNLIKC
jgi:hypothetical protein